MVRQLPMALTFTLFAALLLHGPIGQFADYHQFADQGSVLGIPHAGDVLSNLGFAGVALWAMFTAGPRLLRHPGWMLFVAGLMLTAIGSSYYHLAPENARLLWDRLPIALTCAGLLAATHAMYVSAEHEGRNTLLLAGCAVLSVLWWRWTDLQGQGDLRWYLVFQILPLVLIPIWQALARAPATERKLIAAAIALYAVAKLTELYDHQVQAVLLVVSGHTLKHCLAALASLALVALAQRYFRL